jgi:menaquinone-specific isochorismate synthase
MNAGPLVARSVLLEPAGPDGAIDPFAAALGGRLFARHDLVLAAFDVAATLALPAGLGDRDSVAAVAAVLAGIPTDDEVQLPGSGPVALGALAFDPDGPSALTVPALVYARDAAGTEWVTMVDHPERLSASDPLDAAAARRLVRERTGGPRPAGPGGERRVVRQEGAAPEVYRRAVATALDAIAAGTVDKVVLARSIDLVFGAVPPADEVLRRLVAREPDSTAFAVPHGPGVFLGASPELLVERRGRAVTCCPLAGTVALSGSPADDDRAVARLAASAKDLAEHQLVVEDVAARLAPLCTALSAPPTPTMARLRTLAHLATTVEGVLGGDVPPDVLTLTARLHPTPAVGGTPRRAALALLASLEPEPRDLWAGPVGWIDRHGDGDMIIGIRSATLGTERARLHAGCGIVAGSDPDAEYEETEVKLRPVLDALDPAPPESGGR